jgi:hypothetical protein
VERQRLDTHVPQGISVLQTQDIQNLVQVDVTVSKVLLNQKIVVQDSIVLAYQKHPHRARLEIIVQVQIQCSKFLVQEIHIQMLKLPRVRVYHQKMEHPQEQLLTAQ